LRDAAGFLKSTEGSAAWFWTPIWLLVAAASWGVLFGIISFAGSWAGRAGSRLLAAIAAPVVWLLQSCGFHGAAGLFNA
jgi:hypothetical protein